MLPLARFLERLLNLHRGDLSRGALLFSYLFLIIASAVVGKAARSALFLGEFAAVKLPYTYFVIAVLVGFVVAGYVRLARRVDLRNLLVGSLLFFAVVSVAFWSLARFYHLTGLYPVIYVWVGIYGVLAPAQVWTLANYVLTTREAKRLFGLVGSGAISGWIFAGFFTSTIAKRFGAESLLLGMAGLIALCPVMVILIWRQKQATLLEAAEPATAGEGPQNLRESLNLVLASPYFCAIAAVICLSSFVTTFAGWQFEAFAQQFLVTKDRLAVFFGRFNFYAGITCLSIQLLLTSRVLRRFGIGPALFVVPVAMLLGSVGVLIWGTLLAAILLKGSDQVLRYSIDKSSVELLYLPVPASVKLQVKSFIDTVVWRFGDGLAGITLVIFADRIGLSARQVSWLNMVLILGWLTAALVARRQYVASLRESVREHRLDAERASAPVLDRSTAEVFAANLQAADPESVLYALSLFEVSRNLAAHPAVRDLLTHPAPEVRQKALSILTAAGDKTVLPQVEALLADSDLGVRTEALGYVIRFGHRDPLALMKELDEFPESSVRTGVVAFLGKPGPRQDLETAQLVLDQIVKEKDAAAQPARLEAARLLSVLPDSFDDALQALLADPDSEVQQEAIRAVGHLGKRQFIPVLLDGLRDSNLAPAVADALTEFGDRVVGTLRDDLTDPATPLAARREIAAVLGRIATPAAAQVLVESLLESDTTLRFRVLSALNKLHQQRPDIELDVQMVETVLAAEILGHYRSYQILETLGTELEAHDAMAEALQASMNQEVERIFRLLGLLFPHHDFHSTYVGLQSKNQVVHDNALELLDNILKPQLRAVLVPLLDGEVSLAERIRLANRLVGAKVESREEAVTALVRSEDPWLKSCGAYAVGTLGLRSLEAELDACLSHPDPLLRETARQAKLRLAGAKAVRA